MRTAVLCASLAPFLWFAWKDNLLHLRARRVPRLENLLHLALAGALGALFSGAFSARMTVFFCGLAGLGVLGTLDEMVYHREIPVAEHDVHAKEHFTLLLFVGAVFALTWFGR